MSSQILALPDPKLSKLWQDWIKMHLGRYAKPIVLYEKMRLEGFGHGQIKAGLGNLYPDVPLDELGRDASGRIFDYDLIANCALTKRDDPNIRRLPTKKAQLYTWSNFLTPDECAELRELTDSHLRASTISASHDSHYEKFRTSSTCLLDQLGSPIVDALDEKMSRALGISNTWAEETQAQKYEVGQEFKAHTDYFEPGADEYKQFCATSGQRTWTFMIYLNDVEVGGATRFRKLEKAFTPREGQAVIWNSLTPKGDPNPFTIHHGMKVRKGEKYVITKWYRDSGEGPLLRSD